jgi:hypothetical protein
VVTTSSPIEERDDDEGCDDISTHDSRAKGLADTIALARFYIELAFVAQSLDCIYRTCHTF